MSDNVLQVKTQLRVSKTPHEVFEAIVDPDTMSRYFISWGSGRLDAGKPVVWKWEDYGAQAAVVPQEIIEDRRISFAWAASRAETRVVIDLEPDGSAATIVKVSEAGWPSDAQGIARLAEQTQGWMHMLCCLKAYVEYGINLRTGGLSP